MTDRRLAPLTALSTLTRRPARPTCGRARSSAGARSAAPARRGWSTTPSTPTAAGSPRRRRPSESREELAAGEDRLAWLGLYRPGAAELGALAEQFDLHELAVEDAIKAHQRPKLERYGDTLFVVLSAARYLDEAEEVEFGELHLFVGPDFVITVRHSEAPDLSRGAATAGERARSCCARAARRCCTRSSTRSSTATRRWSPGCRTTSTRSRPRSSAATRGVSRRIYELSQRGDRVPARHPAAARHARRAHRRLRQVRRRRGAARYLRDVADHVTQVIERVDGFRLQLRDILTVNATLVAQRQNEEMRELTEASIAQNEEVKKISAWAAILFAPTLVGTVYGMNFDAHAGAALAPRATRSRCC